MAIQIHDEAGILGPNDLAALQAAAGRWPFEVHLVTSTSAPNPAAFEAQVSRAVTTPNIVAIGIDPMHHKTFVHFGKETGVPASQWSSIYSAGNSDFKSSHWADGIAKIGDRALAAKQQAQTVIIQPDRPASAPESHTGAWIFGGIVVVAAIVGIYYWWRAKQQAEERQRQIDLENEILADKAARNREESTWTDKFRDVASSAPAPAPVYRSSPAPAPRAIYTSPAPAPSTVVVNQTTGGSGGSGDLLTGYMIGRMDSPRVVERDVEVVRERHRRYEDDSPSYSSNDSGGGGSSWGSSSSSNDSGGGSSSWSSDSGGGSSSFDSGSSDSGSFDSGGGGSDW